jgi:hypothetical protein
MGRNAAGAFRLLVVSWPQTIKGVSRGFIAPRPASGYKCVRPNGLPKRFWFVFGSAKAQPKPMRTHSFRDHANIPGSGHDSS